MTNNQANIIIKNENINSGSGNRIIEWNVSDPTESLYAVVTPVKMK
ncbi:hypothetical protein [Neobacillus sp. D3-1R]